MFDDVQASRAVVALLPVCRSRVATHQRLNCATDE
jgi:hypothetical protein